MLNANATTPRDMPDKGSPTNHTDDSEHSLHIS